jgi:hypothetical protein
MRRRTTALLLAILGVIAALPAGALPGDDFDDGRRDNIVYVFNQEDGSERAKSRVLVSPTEAATVENENVAYARSSCADCRTVAVAMQAVLVTPAADNVSPKNVAVALNESCSSCRTFAAAYQYVLTTEEPGRLNEDARRRIRSIQREVSAATRSDLSFPDLDARLDGLYADFKAAVDSGLVEEGRHIDEDSRERHDTES